MPQFILDGATTREPFRVNIAWHNSNPDTIWNKLARELGREPTNAEASARVREILRGER